MLGVRMTLSVPDMNCSHCQMTIEERLKQLSGVRRIVVNLEKKTVDVDGDVGSETVKQAIRDAGYTPVEE